MEREYEISLSRYPIESGHKITEAIKAQPTVPGIGKNYSAHDGKAIPIEKAILKIDGKIIEEKEVTADDVMVTFKTTLSEGSIKLSPYFTFEGGEVGAYYCRVKPVE